MADSIGFYFMILVLVMVPLVILGAGKDTTLKRAERKQRQRFVQPVSGLKYNSCASNRLKL